MTWRQVRRLVNDVDWIARRVAFLAIGIAAVAEYFDGRERDEAARAAMFDKIQALEIKTEAVAQTVGVPAIPDAINDYSTDAVEGETIKCEPN